MSARNFARQAWLAGVTAFLFCALHTAGAQSLSQVQLAIGASATAQAEDVITVVPFEFDPFDTRLVSARWLGGIGCPTNATTNNGVASSAFTDPACPSGDDKDKKNQGLLLAKTGPTPNFASAGASLKGVKGIRPLTELGYDIRSGGHCGAGAPRFNVVTTNGTTETNHFVGCSSPPGLPVSISPSWKRLRWTALQLAAAFPPILPTDQVVSIDIIFDEGSDTGPDFSGVAIIDNIDVNGTLVGKGPES